MLNFVSFAPNLDCILRANPLNKEKLDLRILNSRSYKIGYIK